MSSISEVTLELRPEQRLDVIDVNREVENRLGDFLSRHRKALYCSYHTTAGYLDQHLSERVGCSRTSVHDFLRPYQALFPPGANYRHDRLEERLELSEEQRLVEPRNADSHLTFIGSGLKNCVTYRTDPAAPVYFIDLDGVNAQGDGAPRHRQRRTTILGYDREQCVDRVSLAVPVSGHGIDSVNLRDPRLGLLEGLHELLARFEIRKGRIDIELHPDEEHAALTVNEDETLLMAHDLRDVLKDPMRFVAQKGRNMLRDPRAIPGKAKEYAKYDLVQVMNKFIDRFGLSDSLVERVIDTFLAVPAGRHLRVKRSVSLLVSDSSPSHNGDGLIVQGQYQSPLLIQWRKAELEQRHLRISLWRFE